MWEVIYTSEVELVVLGVPRNETAVQYESVGIEIDDEVVLASAVIYRSRSGQIKIIEFRKIENFK